MNDKNIKYYVNKKAGVVKGYYSFNTNDFIEEINALSRKSFAEQHLFVEPTNALQGDKAFKTIVIKASAHCHCNDVFDENIGMKIVRNKIIKKYYLQKIKFFEQFSNCVENLNERIVESLTCAVTGLADISDQLEELEN